MHQVPRILVVLRHDLRKGRSQNIVQEAHLEQIIRHGGVPIPVPSIEGTTPLLDKYGPMHGLLIVEGNDVGIEHHVGDIECPPELIEEPDIGRDEVEFALITQLIQEGQPYLGLCRGCHTMNIARGGTLYGDVMHELGSDLKHVDYDDYDGYRHELSISPGTPLHRWLGTTSFMANSYHHQGIRSLGEGLEAMCHTADGLVEGFYDRDHPFRIGLQFHPERHVADHPECMRIFEAFVEAARNFAATGKAG